MKDIMVILLVYMVAVVFLMALFCNLLAWFRLSHARRLAFIRDTRALRSAVLPTQTSQRRERSIRRTSSPVIPPIHPPSSFIFDQQRLVSTRTSMPASTQVEKRRAYLSTAIPLGTVLQTSAQNDEDTILMADFGYEIPITTINDVTCPICLVGYEGGEAIRCSEKCHHVFHSHCIVSWLLKSNECPICRGDFVVGTPAVAPVEDLESGYDFISRSESATVDAGAIREESDDDHRTLSNLLPSFLPPEMRFEYLSDLISVGVIRSRPLGGLQVNFREGTSSSYQLVEEADCLLCSQPYRVGSVMGHSPNEQCGHMFHRECIVHHLLHSTQCPHCQREYVNLNGVYDAPSER